MVTRAKARYDIIARDRTRRGIESARRGFANLGRSVANVGTRLTAVVAGFTAAATATFQVGRGFAELAENQVLLSQRFGLTVDTLQRFQTVARLTGVRIEQFTTLFQRLIRRSEEAQQGNERVAQAFEFFGLTIEDLQRLDPEGLFLALADGVAAADNETRALQKTIELLDVEGGKLFNTLRRGSIGITELGARANAVGAILDEDVVKTSAEAATEIELLAQAFATAGQRIRAEFVPIAEEAARAINDFLAGTEESGEQADQALLDLLNRLQSIRDEIADVSGRLQRIADTTVAGDPLAGQAREEAAQELRELAQEFAQVRREIEVERSRNRINTGAATLQDITRVGAAGNNVELSGRTLRSLEKIQADSAARTAQSLADALGRNGIIARTSQ